MIIYKTTNLIDGKIYIGQDSKDDDKYYGSGYIIRRAIKKYGKLNFKREILERCSSKSELNEREIFWIDKLKSRDPDIGYNITAGGEGFDSELKKKHWSDKNSVYRTDEFIKKKRKYYDSAECKRKMSDITKQNYLNLDSGYHAVDYIDKLKRSHQTVEYLEKWRSSIKKTRDNPDAYCNSDEFKEVKRQKCLEKWRDPIYKQMMLNARKNKLKSKK